MWIKSSKNNMNITPTGQNILIKLPNYQKERERATGIGANGGINIVHLEGEMQHESTHGTVMAVGPDCDFILPGDEVFFTYLCISQAKQNMGKDKCANGMHGSGVPAFYFEEPDADYVIMPYRKVVEVIEDISGVWENPLFPGVILLIRSGEIICCNDYYTFEAAYDNGEIIGGVRAKTTASGLLIAKLQDEPEKEKYYRITNAPANRQAKQGDLVFTVPHSDIPLEGYFNFHMLPKGTFYMEENQILAIYEQQKVA
jgi:co-chaperonin GroES (HSP10)